MHRRFIKPFTVEIRRSGRRLSSKADAPIGSDEQPHVAAWPGEMYETARSSPSAEPQPAAIVAPTGRILPVLDNPRPPMVAADLTADLERAAIDETDAVEEEGAGAAPPVDARIIAKTLLLRQGRSRLPRDAFRREERWRARLPAAVHRTRKRGT